MDETTTTATRDDTELDRARLALCGAAVVFIRSLDTHAGLSDTGYRLERLRYAADDYLTAVHPKGHQALRGAHS